MTPDPMAEIRAGFFAECDEHLEALQDALTSLTAHTPSGPEPDGEVVNTLFRAVHSIKGGAGAFGLSALVGFAHHLENTLDALRAGRIALGEALLKQLFAAADLLQDHVRAAALDSPEPEGGAACLSALAAFGGAQEEEPFPAFAPVMLHLEMADAEEPEGSAEGDAPPWHVTLCPLPGFYESGNEVLYLLRALSELGAGPARCDTSLVPALGHSPLVPCLRWHLTLPGSLPESELREVFDFVEGLCAFELVREQTASPAPPPEPADTLPEHPAVPADLAPDAFFPTPEPSPSEPAPATSAPQPQTPRDGGDMVTVRVDLERIDRLVNLVGEMVINQAMLAQSVAEAGLQPNSTVMTGLETFAMLTRDMQDSVMMIRAQPVKPLFQRMARVLREACGATGKDVRLVTEGEATEVDKTVIERLAEPLTHMIRNAIDHGIETVEQRLASGKSAQGRIKLSAQHRSGRLVIELSDDGQGIDRRKVLSTAIARNLVSPEARPSESEIDNLLFLPGFSTASTVSALSGRGVGMDVVRTAIHALGGRITLRSSPGQGTCFSVSLPLTLAVLDGMVIRVAGETLVIPLSAIVETAALLPEDIRPIGPGHHVMQLRGSFLPLFDLGAELGFRTPRRLDDGGIVLLTAQDNGPRSALIIDAIVEQRQVVIKGLQRSAGRSPGIAAATILGNGRVALILDPADLIARAGTSSEHHPPGLRPAATASDLSSPPVSLPPFAPSAFTSLPFSPPQTSSRQTQPLQTQTALT